MKISSSTKVIAENVHVLSQVVTSVCEKRYLDKVAPKFLTDTQFSILRILNSSGPLTVSKLAELLMVSKPATSKNIDILFRNKLINREIIESDRRATLVTILSKGKEIIRKYEELRMTQQCSVLDHFNEKEKKEFARLLEKYILYCISDKDFNAEIICLKCNGKLGEECSVSKNQGQCHFNLTNK